MQEYDPEALLGLELSRGQVEAALALLESLPAAARLALPGMLPGREDVLPWGLRILLGAMSYCRRDSVVICDRDLLYGILLSGGIS
jgi:exopolyphosphatase/guanosine-5'-triphosphate,3'-diphosphate pyrophosphatase